MQGVLGSQLDNHASHKYNATQHMGIPCSAHHYQHGYDTLHTKLHHVRTIAEQQHVCNAVGDEEHTCGPGLAGSWREE